MPSDRITVRGAREHNLKNLNVDMPRDRLIVITGLSGSGKSSLAVDTLYAELQGRGARALKEPRDFPYGMRDFDAEDLDGNHLGFGMETPAR